MHGVKAMEMKYAFRVVYPDRNIILILASVNLAMLGNIAMGG
jgi:hypothetical protein